MRPAVFLDRDGILNDIVYRGDVVGSPRTFEEFSTIAEAGPLVFACRELGYFTAIVTNQPDLERGLMSAADLEKMHVALLLALPIDTVAYCGSGSDADPRRKPNPGMLLELAAEFDLDLSRSWIIGDSSKDILAGQRAGVRTILKKTSYNTAAHGSADYDCATYREMIDVLRKN
jgi:D-glycero-D-manno-heptose 1,7-bisphosphate phosphatase